MCVSVCSCEFLVLCCAGCCKHGEREHDERYVLHYVEYSRCEKNNDVVSLSDVVYRDTVDKVKNAKQKKQVKSHVTIAC